MSILDLIQSLPGISQVSGLQRHLLNTPTASHSPPVWPTLTLNNIRGMTYTPSKTVKQNGVTYGVPRGATSWDPQSQNFNLKYGVNALPVVSSFSQQGVSKRFPQQQHLPIYLGNDQRRISL